MPLSGVQKFQCTIPNMSSSISSVIIPSKKHLQWLIFDLLNLQLWLHMFTCMRDRLCPQTSDLAPMCVYTLDKCLKTLV